MWDYLPLGDGLTVMLPFDKDGGEISPPTIQIKPHNIGTLVARVSVQYRRVRDIGRMNLVWTDLA